MLPHLEGLGEFRVTERPDLADTVAALRPQLERLRRGEWRLLIMGPATSRERDEAALLSARLMDLADAVVEGSR